jgi:16S rRNA (guanine966-N2)-methyltransferase
MRIIGGSSRGRKLVEWQAAGIRPMRDFVRTALFNIIGETILEARFLDLFCGTGSVGLEALSRGAREVTFIDQSADACGIVRRNLDQLGFLDRARVLHVDYVEGIDYLERRGKKFDLVFVGPPYDKGLADAALRLFSERSILDPDAVVITEVRNKTTLDQQYGLLKQIDKRVYGDNVLDFYRATTGR